MTTLEKDIERKLRLMVQRHKGRCLKWVCPGWSGVPDRIIILPGGHIIFADVKLTRGSRDRRRSTSSFVKCFRPLAITRLVGCRCPAT